MNNPVYTEEGAVHTHATFAACMCVSLEAAQLRLRIWPLVLWHRFLLLNLNILCSQATLNCFLSNFISKMGSSLVNMWMGDHYTKFIQLC